MGLKGQATINLGLLIQIMRRFLPIAKPCYTNQIRKMIFMTKFCGKISIGKHHGFLFFCINCEGVLELPFTSIQWLQDPKGAQTDGLNPAVLGIDGWNMLESLVELCENHTTVIFNSICPKIIDTQTFVISQSDLARCLAISPLILDTCSSHAA